jgi:hypothetical protein
VRHGEQVSSRAQASLAPPRENGFSVDMSNFYVVCKGKEDGADGPVLTFIIRLFNLDKDAPLFLKRAHRLLDVYRH